LHKFKSPVQDFLATVLVFKLHIFSRDGLVFDFYTRDGLLFDSYQSENVG